MPKLNINKKLIPIKAYYFLWNAGIAPVVPFMSVYARQLGFSSIAVGVIYTFSPIAILLIKPISGAIADKFKCHKLVFFISQLLIILSSIGLIFLPRYSENPANLQIKNVSSEKNITTLEVCMDQNITKGFGRNNLNLCEFNCTKKTNEWKINTLNSFTVISDVFLNKSQDEDCFEAIIKNSESLSQYILESLNNKSVTCDINCQIREERTSLAKHDQNDVYRSYQFWLYFFVFLNHMMGRAITIIFGDSICFNILGDSPHKYGYQRMFGALGWGISSIFVGFLIDMTSSHAFEKNYSSAFLLGAGLMITCLIVSFQLKYTQHQVNKHIFKDLTRVLSSARIIVFILWCLFLGTSTTLVRNYLFWLLDDLAKEHGAEANIKTIQGIAMGVRSLGGELPFFFVSSWLLKRVKHVYIMNFVLLLTGVRILLYSILSNPWWCIPVELLNGLTFGIYYSTMKSYASIIAPPGTKTTTQGLVGAVYEGAGYSLGALIGGFLYDEYGGSMMFKIFGFVSLIAFLLLVVAQLLIEKCSSKEEEMIYGPQI